MEAATPLRNPHVRTVGDRLAIDGLVVDDDSAVRLAREREESGDDVVAVVTDAIEIGARVLDREQAGANAEYVKAEFGKVSKEVEHAFADKAREVADFFGTKVDEVFGPENGQLARELEKLFSDGSTASVQNRVRELLDQAMVKYREDLVRQFAADDGKNPLADFKAGTVRALKQAEERQHHTQHALLERMSELEKQLQALRLEKEKLEELDEERERGSAKGRSFEELVAEAVDALAVGLGDDAEAVGDVKGPTGKTGDVVVAIDAACGPARGRVVFEAKDQRLSKPKALEELDRAMRERDADFAVLVVPSEEEVPARMHPLREYNGDKLIVTLDPEEGSRLALELGYRLARARVLMSKASGEEVDAAAIRDTAERAAQAMDDVRKVKSQLTGAKKNIDEAYGGVEAVADRVRAHLAEIEALSRAGEPEEAQGQLG
jgi:Uncharacterized protein conserved in bacteria (DUF2130)